MRTKEQWLEEFNSTLPKCSWFIYKYFGFAEYKKLIDLGLKGDTRHIIKILNEMWYKLPDSFNIFNGMEEFRSFIGLIEFYDENEYKQIVL